MYGSINKPLRELRVFSVLLQHSEGQGGGVGGWTEAKGQCVAGLEQGLMDLAYSDVQCSLEKLRGLVWFCL